MSFNPVELRLLDLAGHWESFRNNDSKRLLIWRAKENALRFYQCFLEIQKYESDYTVGDLFIVLDVPFQNSIQYSRALKESLADQYKASLEDLQQQEIAPDWRFDPGLYPDSASGFVQSFLAFGSHHHKSIGHLVAVFMPAEVSGHDDFAAWLTRALDRRLPERCVWSP
ncbi:MAG: hypothetical protein ACRERU_22800 [Methylococcales bacterium]